LCLQGIQHVAASKTVAREFVDSVFKTKAHVGTYRGLGER